MTVCSGIGAPEVAAPWVDWRWQSEIEPFPCAVLAHRFTDAVNLGDMTKFKEWPDATVNVLVGGTPCQSFSVAGLRKGLDDPRGNLMLTYLAIARRYQPKWLVWENVPGVLSSNGGRDFGAFLRGLGECGYGFAYRVLDAQFVRTSGFPRAVPQRRRRVFVVGCLGDWRRAAAVLFDAESMSGNPPPRREAGERIAARAASGVAIRGREGGGTAELTGDVATALRASQGGGDKPHALVAPTIPSRGSGGGGLGTDFDCDGGLIAKPYSIMPMNSGKDYKARETDVAQPLMVGGPVGGNQGGDYIAQPVAPTLNAHFGDKMGLENQHINQGGACSLPPVSMSLNAHGARLDAESETLLPTTGGVFDVAHSLRGEGFDASEDGTGRGTPLVAFSAKDYGADADAHVAPTLRAGGHDKSHANAGVMPAIAFHNRQDPDASGAVTHPLGAKDNGMAVAFDLRGREGGAMPEGPHETANLRAASGGSSRPYVAQPYAVRRLTPEECEALMGFPRNWTRIPYRNKPADACSDGPRYKALGNSIAINCLELIFERMRWVEQEFPAERTEAAE